MAEELQTGWLVYVGLGANLPWAAPDGTVHAPAQTLRLAAQALGELGTVTAGSSLWRSEPVGPVKEQPLFVNGAATLRTRFSPKQLMRELVRLEERFGRVRAEAKGPRTLDLDMLLAEEVLEGAMLPVVAYSFELMLPHPEMDRRRFVLEPLAEIAPALRHPLLRKSVGELLRALPEGEQAERLHEPGLPAGLPIA